MTHPTLYLASASPRRHDILNQLGIRHKVLDVPAPTDGDEPQLEGEPADRYVRRTAQEKARHATRWLEREKSNANETGLDTQANSALPLVSPNNRIILCADTVVILDGLVLGKPIDLKDAALSLKRLSGRTHQVHTAVVVQRDTALFESVSISEVHFKSLTDAEIEAYCNTKDSIGKAGAYGIQGPAASFITHLSGSYTGVMGLPAYETVELLKAADYLRS